MFGIAVCVVHLSKGGLWLHPASQRAALAISAAAAFAAAAALQQQVCIHPAADI